MKSLLIRTGSFTIPGSNHISLLPRSGSFRSPNLLSLHFNRRNSSPASGLRRALSESDVVRYAGFMPEVEELGFSGGGTGRGRRTGGGDVAGGGVGGDRSEIGAYYLEMLRLNPGDSLLLTNYAKFLYEVEGDKVKAEEYYGRAVLANPGDGEVLALYGKLIWETERDSERAKSYFDRALQASPDDCTVLGSYAHFMWEADDDGEEDNGVAERKNELPMTLVEAF